MAASVMAARTVTAGPAGTSGTPGAGAGTGIAAAGRLAWTCSHAATPRARMTATPCSLPPARPPSAADLASSYAAVISAPGPGRPLRPGPGPAGSAGAFGAVHAGQDPLHRARMDPESELLLDQGG